MRLISIAIFILAICAITQLDGNTAGQRAAQRQSVQHRVDTIRGQETFVSRVTRGQVVTATRTPNPSVTPTITPTIMAR